MDFLFRTFLERKILENDRKIPKIFFTKKIFRNPIANKSFASGTLLAMDYFTAKKKNVLWILLKQ